MAKSMELKRSLKLAANYWIMIKENIKLEKTAISDAVIDAYEAGFYEALSFLAEDYDEIKICKIGHDRAVY